jgi:beta-mannosidase
MPESKGAEELSPVRRCLSDGPFVWELARQDISEKLSEIPQDSDWQCVACATTVAHALQITGQWSLDSAPIQFDASIWWFRLRFDHATEANSKATESWLVFDGLATHCQVWLNEECILSSANMFLQYRLRVDRWLKTNGNVLLLRFDALDNALQAKRPRPRWRTPMVSHQQLRWIRTTLLGRTPGWSPPAAPVGPWRPIWLEQLQPAQLVRFALRPTVVGRTGQLRVDCWFHERRATHTYAVLIVEGPNTRVEEPLQTDTDDHSLVQVTVPNVHLWWPHTHGDPVLYRVTLEVREVSGRSALQRLGQVGFRTIRRIDDPEHFRILVNDEVVFCRGACWMPLNA